MSIVFFVVIRVVKLFFFVKLFDFCDEFFKIFVFCCFIDDVISLIIEFFLFGFLLFLSGRKEVFKLV